MCSTKQAQDGRPNTLRPLIQADQVGIESDPVAVQYLPFRPSLVYLRVQVLQTEDLQDLHEQLLRQIGMPFVAISSS